MVYMIFFFKKRPEFLIALIASVFQAVPSDTFSSGYSLYDF